MSNASDFLTKPYPGLTKYDDNTLRLSRPLAEIQAFATDATVTGTDGGALRLRNIYAANGAGPNVYFEGINSAAAVKQLARIQAAFVTHTSGSEVGKLVLSALKGGGNAQVALRGDATANMAPVSAGAVALGTQALPWLEAYVGDTGGTRYAKLTATGPGTNNAIVTEGGSFSIYNGTQASLIVAASGVTIGTLLLAGATNGVGLQTTLTGDTGHSGTITGNAITTTSVGTTGVVTGLQYTFNGDTDYGLRILAGTAGDDLLYGVYIDTTAEITTAAYFQKQRAGAAGSFLVLQNSSATPLFTVNSSGNIVFGTTGQRITGDFSNATAANQVMVQSSTTNGATNLGLMPNGTGTSGSLTLYGGSDPANANWLKIAATTTGVVINTDSDGTGTTQAITFQADTVASLQLLTNGDVVAGKASLAIANTNGHFYIPAVAGVMTGVPTARAGFVPVVYDTTNNKFTVYNAAWKQSAALA